MPRMSGITVSDTTKSADGSTNRIALALLAPDHHLADAQADAPQDVGVHRGLPVLEPEVDDAERIERLGAEDDQQHEERSPDEDPTRPPAVRRDALVGDDVDEVAVTHVLGPAHEDEGHAAAAALRAKGWGARSPRTPDRLTRCDR